MNKDLKKKKDKGLLDFFCPVCGHNKFDRTPRTVFEKLKFYLSFGKSANKKFVCKSCGWEVLLGKSNR